MQQEERTNGNGEELLEGARGWITAPADLGAALLEQSKARVAQRIEAQLFSMQDVENLSKRKLEFIERSLNLSSRELQHARRLAALCAVEFKEPPVRSHRPYIGPLIVVVKRFLFQLMRPLLQETVKQQRAFNAALVEAYVDSCDRGKPQ